MARFASDAEYVRNLRDGHRNRMLANVRRASTPPILQASGSTALTQGLNPTEPAKTGDIATDTFANSWLGKTLGSFANTSFGGNVLKVLGTTGAITQPIVEEVAARYGAGLNALQGDPLSDRQKQSLSSLQSGDGDIFGKIGTNVSNLWGGDPTDPSQRVRMGVDAVDAFTGETDKPLQDRSGVQSWTRAAAGFGLDVFTDPLTYVPGAALTKPLRVAKTTTKTGTRAAREMAKSLGEETGTFSQRFADNWKSTDKNGRSLTQTYKGEAVPDAVKASSENLLNTSRGVARDSLNTPLAGPKIEMPDITGEGLLEALTKRAEPTPVIKPVSAFGDIKTEVPVSARKTIVPGTKASDDLAKAVDTAGDVDLELKDTLLTKVAEVPERVRKLDAIPRPFAERSVLETLTQEVPNPAHAAWTAANEAGELAPPAATVRIQPGKMGFKPTEMPAPVSIERVTQAIETGQFNKTKLRPQAIQYLQKVLREHAEESAEDIALGAVRTPEIEPPATILETLTRDTGQKAVQVFPEKAIPGVTAAGETMGDFRKKLSRMVTNGLITKEERAGLMAQARKAYDTPEAAREAFENAIREMEGYNVSEAAAKAAMNEPISPVAMADAAAEAITTPTQRVMDEFSDAETLLRYESSVGDLNMEPAFNQAWKASASRTLQRFEGEAGFSEKSATGTRRNATTFGEGKGDNVEAWNTPTQADFLFDFLKAGPRDKVIAAIRESGQITAPVGKAFDSAVQDAANHVMATVMADAMYAAAKRAERVGISPSIGWGKSGRPLAIGEAMQILVRGAKPSRKASKAAKATGIAVGGVSDRWGNLGQMFGNPATAVPITNMMDGIDALLGLQTRLRSVDDIVDGYRAVGVADEAGFQALMRETLMKELTKPAVMRSGGRVTQVKANLIDGGPQFDAALTVFNTKASQGARRAGKAAKVVSPEEFRAGLFNAYADRIMASVPEMYTTMIENAQRLGIKADLQTKHMDVVTAQRAVEIAETGTTSEAIALVKAPEKILDEVANEIAAMPAAVITSARHLDENMPSIVPPSMRQELLNTDKVVRAAQAVWNTPTPSPKAMKAAKEAAYQKHADAVNAWQQGMKPADVIDLDFNPQMAIHAGILAKLGRHFKKFAFHSGKGELGEATMVKLMHVRDLSVNYHNRVAQVEKALSGPSPRNPETSMFNEAFFAIKNGTEDLPPDLFAAVKQVEEVMSLLVGTKPTSLGGAIDYMAKVTDNAFTREFGTNLERVNYYLARAGLTEFDLSVLKPAKATKAERQARKAAGEAPVKAQTPSLAAVADQWKAWDIEDPLSFLSKMQTTLVSVAKEASVAQEFLRIARTKHAVSDIPRQGWVKVTGSNKSHLLSWLPEGQYFHPEVAGFLKQTDDFLQEMSTTKGSAFIRDRFAPVQDLWKSGMTIWNPRHHATNLIGDMSMTYIAGHSGSYIKAAQLLKRKGYFDKHGLPQHAADAWSGEQSAMALTNQMPNPDLVKSIKEGQVFDTITLKGGRQVQLTADDIYNSFRQRGGLPAAPIKENLQDNFMEATGNAGVTNRLRDKMRLTGRREGSKGSFREVRLVPFSEGRDHFARLAHYMPALKKHAKSASSLEEAMDLAAAEVRKWHPDGTGMTPFEQRYMRTIMPFYSWSRKAIPLTLESFLTKPGRVLIYPKAMYALAQANGVQLQSLSNPFPVDQMFPSFMRENMTGPIGILDGNYIGMRPGIFFSDVTTEFGGGSLADAKAAGNPLDVGPARGALSSLSPIIKTPLELMTGSNLGTGGRIADTSDYLDSQIPGINVVSQLTGVSTTGTLLNAGQTADGGIGFDQARAVDQGYRDPVESKNWLNYLTGLRAQNMSQENYINLAEIEARNRMNPKRF